MIALLLMTMAVAKDPPDKPSPFQPVPDQCRQAIPVRSGDTSDCRGVLLPTSWMADYEQVVSYNNLLRELYRIDTGSLEYQLDLTKNLLEEARKPVPLLEKPAFWTGVGLVAGGAVVIGGGYALGAAGGSSGN